MNRRAGSSNRSRLILPIPNGHRVPQWIATAVRGRAGQAPPRRGSGPCARRAASVPSPRPGSGRGPGRRPARPSPGTRSCRPRSRCRAHGGSGSRAPAGQVRTGVAVRHDRPGPPRSSRRPASSTPPTSNSVTSAKPLEPRSSLPAGRDDDPRPAPQESHRRQVKVVVVQVRDEDRVDGRVVDLDDLSRPPPHRADPATQHRVSPVPRTPAVSSSTVEWPSQVIRVISPIVHPATLRRGDPALGCGS